MHSNPPTYTYSHPPNHPPMHVYTGLCVYPHTYLPTHAPAYTYTSIYDMHLHIHLKQTHYITIRSLHQV